MFTSLPTFEVVVLLSLVVIGTEAASLYEPCVTNCNCLTKNSVCVSSPQGCSTQSLRYCQCADGFRPDPGHNCLKESRVGEECGADFVCVDEFTECNTTVNKCECVLGFKRIGSVGRCVSNMVKVHHGEACSEYSDCNYDQDCVGGVCRCLDGYVYSEEDEGCVDAQIDDPCVSDYDCMAANNAECVSGTCACRSGYVAKQASVKGRNMQICLPSNNTRLSDVGQRCNERGMVERWSVVNCKPNLRCFACLNDPLEHVCISKTTPKGCSVPNIANGYVTVSLQSRTDVMPVRDGLKAQLVCEEGYQISRGSSSAFCDESGWSEQLGNCE